VHQREAPTRQLDAIEPALGGKIGALVVAFRMPFPANHREGGDACGDEGPLHSRGGAGPIGVCVNCGMPTLPIAGYVNKASPGVAPSAGRQLRASRNTFGRWDGVLHALELAQSPWSRSRPIPPDQSATGPNASRSKSAATAGAAVAMTTRTDRDRHNYRALAMAERTTAAASNQYGCVTVGELRVGTLRRRRLLDRPIANGTAANMSARTSAAAYSG
jgi:hypothetical protein